MEIKPPVQHEDLVARCRQNHLEPSRLLSCSTTKDILPFLRLISPGGLLTPQVCRCLCGGASIPDVDAPFEPRLPGVPVDTNAIPEVGDQELNTNHGVQGAVSCRAADPSCSACAVGRAGQPEQSSLRSPPPPVPVPLADWPSLPMRLGIVLKPF